MRIVIELPFANRIELSNKTKKVDEKLNSIIDFEDLHRYSIFSLNLLLKNIFHLYLLKNHNLLLIYVYGF